MSETRFTERAQAALRLAQECSAELGHGYVGSEHLLLGLAREGRGVAAKVLQSAGLEPESLKAAIARMVGVGAPGGAPSQGLTPRCKKIIELSLTEAARLGHHYVGTEHLLLGILREGDGVAVRVLSGAGVEPRRLRRRRGGRHGGRGLPLPLPGRRQDPGSGSTAATQSCWTSSPAISPGWPPGACWTRWWAGTGRSTGSSRSSPAARRTIPPSSANPAWARPPWPRGWPAGSSPGMCPTSLRAKRLLSLDLSSMVAGTKYRGEFEERVKNILAEVRRVGGIILFIDELHTIVGAGSAEGAIDAANIIKPALGRGELQVIGATTTDEYRKYIEKDAALERRFQPVTGTRTRSGHRPGHPPGPAGPL